MAGQRAAASSNTAWARPTSLDFFAYISGTLPDVGKETYHGPGGDVALEVYYDPAHPYDVDDMLASSRAGLDYYQTHLQSLPVLPVPHF